MGNVIPIKSGMEADVRTALAKVTAQAAALGIVMSDRLTHFTDEELLCCLRIEIKKTEMKAQGAGQATSKTPEKIRAPLLNDIEIVEDVELLDLLSRVKNTGIKKYKGDGGREGLKSYLREELQKREAQAEKVIDVPTEWQWNAPMPVDLCRIPLFSPITLGPTRVHVENKEIAQSAWGGIIYDGAALDHDDEDVLLAVLALIYQQCGGKPTSAADYRYKGSRAEILELLGLSDGGKNTKRVRNTLKRFRGATIEIRASKSESFKVENGFITALSGNDRSGSLDITLHEYFFKRYEIKGGWKPVDVKRRVSLGGGVPKALHKFMVSHSKSKWVSTRRDAWDIIATAINLPARMPNKEKRRLLRNAIQKLITEKILTKESKLMSSGGIALYLSASARK